MFISILAFKYVPDQFKNKQNGTSVAGLHILMNDKDSTLLRTSVWGSKAVQVLNIIQVHLLNI